MSKANTWVVNNIRTEDLQKTIERYKGDGWKLHSFAQVSGAGHIGVTFTAVFERPLPNTQKEGT
jgi:hypothetical protein